jgi:HK97 family phage portal protein
VGFEVNAVVNACIRVTSDQIGVAALQSYSVKADGTVVLHPNDELQTLLDQPGRQLSGFTFRRTHSLHLVMYGNAYALIQRQRGSEVVTGLRMIHPERMQQVIVDTETDEIVAYYWQDSSGKQHLTPWVDMVHTKDLLIDPDGWFGFPRGRAALADMVTDGEASKHVRQVLSNSGIPALVFFARQGTGKAILDEAEAAWQDRMARNGGRGSTRFLAGIESMQVLGHSLKDLEFPAIRQVNREDICAAYGVDPRLIGIGTAKGTEGGLSGSQYQEARRRLEQQTCSPMRIATQDSLDTTLTPNFGHKYARYSPDDIAAIVETPTEVAQRSVVLVAGNVATIDEGRRLNGLPERMTPTHITATPMLQTVKEALEAEERKAQQALKEITSKTVAKGAATGEMVEGPEGMTSTETAKGRSVEGAAAAPLALPAAPEAPVSRQAAAPSRLRGAEAADTMTPEDEQAAWAVFDARARALEPELEEVAMGIIEEALELAIDAALRADDVRAESDSWWTRFIAGLAATFSGTGPIRRLWERMMGRTLRTLMNQVAEEFAEEAGTDFDANDPRFRAGIRQRLTTLADSTTGTIAKALGEALEAARAAGLSGRDVVTLLRGLDLRYIAQRVARTESVGLINHAERMAVSQMPGIRKKRWLSQRDSLVRSSHQHCDSVGYIDIEAPFPNGLQYPHDPNGSAEEVDNCRCGAVYSVHELTV